MIRTFSNLLEKLMEKERELLPEYDEIQHPGLFGEMYEGLTKVLVEKALFEGMDLQVASGKIRNSKGNLSGQIDCMVVLGSGEPIPHTQHFTYAVDKVIMIVEVKKTLYGAKLNEAMDLFRQFWKEVSEPNPPQTELINDAWRALFKRNPPKASEVASLPFHEEMIYHTILVEATLPLRVVFGYDGYVDEYGLREGMVGYLEEITALPPEKRLRFNINAFPNLIVCRKASLIKLNGMPYSGMIDGRGLWWWMGSRGSEPFHSLLELLWTRLAFIFKLSPDIFGEDLEMESITPLLAAKAEKMENQAGWKYENMPIKRDELEKGADREAWHPPTLSKAECVIVNILCKKGEIDMVEKGFLEFVSKEGETAESICKSLNQKGLTTVAGKKLVLITDECACMFLPDGRCVAAENKSGRLVRYAMKLTEEVRRRRAKENLSPVVSATPSSGAVHFDPKRKIGILAFGSLIGDPGSEIAPRIVMRIKTPTPFGVEYGRYSLKTRAGAPTLIPHTMGEPVDAEILVLDDSVSVEDATDMLWRRERRRTDSKEKYLNRIASNTVLVEQHLGDPRVTTILYTDCPVKEKIETPRADELAEHAISSVKKAKEGMDGISYLMNNISSGVKTQLTAKYEAEILKQTKTQSLSEALKQAKAVI